MNKKNKESKAPGLVEAYGKSIEYQFVVLKYIWPFFLILFVGIFIITNFREYLLRYEPGTIILFIIIFGVIGNVLYYRWVRAKNHDNKTS